MSIAAYGTAAFAAGRSVRSFQTLKAELSAVQGQLSTGKAATTYAGLGTGVAPSLNLRARLNTLDQHAASIDDGQLRVRLMSASLEEIGKVADSLPTSLSRQPGDVAAGVTNVAVSASNALATVVDALNLDVNGRYLFAGRASDTEPVLSPGLMLDGDTSRAGLKTLIAERKAADAGPNGMGRLVLTASGSTVALREESAGLPFGLKIGTATATGAGLTAGASGSPRTATLGVAAQPASGDTVAVSLTLPDGTAQTIRLVAGGTSDPDATSFAIGATLAATAANIASALGSAVSRIVAETLPSASAMKAATAFFAADATAPPMRVAGPPFDTATALVAGTAQNTVVWYRGDNSASPRETAPLRVGDDRTLGIGAQANEPAFRTLLASLAALASETFPASDATSRARYTSLTDRVSATLAPANGVQSVADVAADLSVAAATMKASNASISLSRNQAQDALAAIEDVDPNEAAMKLLALQTQLQASYQSTAALQKLSLLNYL